MSDSTSAEVLVSSAEVVLRALDVLEVVLATPEPAEAMANARSMLLGLDEETLRRVAGYLAHAVVRARDAGAVARFIDRQRLEATVELPGVPR